MGGGERAWSRGATLAFPSTTRMHGARCTTIVRTKSAGIKPGSRSAPRPGSKPLSASPTSSCPYRSPGRRTPVIRIKSRVLTVASSSAHPTPCGQSQHGWKVVMSPQRHEPNPARHVGAATRLALAGQLLLTLADHFPPRPVEFDACLPH